jgi:hypothetical protein
MATSASLPTRQQLDEIDNLLKRMLALPPLDGEVTENPPASLSFPAPTIREVPPPQPPAPGDPVVHSWRVEWPQQPPAAAHPAPPTPPPVTAWGSPVPARNELPPWTVNSPPPPFAVPVPPAGPPPAPTASPVFATPVPTPPAAAPGSDSLLVQFLLLLNGTFNALTYLLGPVGTWLRGPGRNTIGWAGIAMLLTAAAWALGDWYGYEWPRPDLGRLGIGAR